MISAIIIDKLLNEFLAFLTQCIEFEKQAKYSCDFKDIIMLKQLKKTTKEIEKELREIVTINFICTYVI